MSVSPSTSLPTIWPLTGVSSSVVLVSSGAVGASLTFCSLSVTGMFVVMVPSLAPTTSECALAPAS
ncbi:hypothetical protein D3C86_1650850 [compost metagenome]